MKRKPKKLTLSRESLSILDRGNLSLVAGGVTLRCSTAACTTGATASTCAVVNTNCVGY